MVVKVLVLYCNEGILEVLRHQVAIDILLVLGAGQYGVLLPVSAFLPRINDRLGLIGNLIEIQPEIIVAGRDPEIDPEAADPHQ